MTDYTITKIYKENPHDPNERIESVTFKRDFGEEITRPIEAAFLMIDRGDIFSVRKGFFEKIEVHREYRQGVPYLRTVADGLLDDNLL